MANLLVAVEMTEAQVSLNGFSTPPGIYLAQLQATLSPQNIGNFVIDIHGNKWFFVGPGSRPFVHQLSGTTFLLMFEYLSHLTIRSVDISTWPPTQVNPVSVTGGPNPPTSFTYNIQFSNDAYALRQQSNTGVGHVGTQLSPPYLKKVNIVFDPLTNTYSVELQPDPTWVDIIAPGITPFFRLYRSPLGPFTPTLIMDWNTTLDFPSSQVGGPFQWQYAASVGELWNPLHPNNLSDHYESALGAIEAFDSTTMPLQFNLTPVETETLEQLSSNGYGMFGTKQAFYVEALQDSERMVFTTGTAPLLAFDEGTSGFSTMGTRPPFIIESEADTMKYGQQVSPPLAGGNAACTLY